MSAPKIRKLQEDAEDNIESREIVVIIGPPKSDKRNLINFLLSNRLINNWDEGEEGSIELGQYEERKSLTYTPDKKKFDPKSGWTVWECPSKLNKTRLSTQNGNLQKQDVRVLVVVPSKMVRDKKPWELYKLLNYVKGIYSNYANGMSLVITKFEEETVCLSDTYMHVEKWVEEAKDAFNEEELNGSGENSDLITNGKLVLSQVLSKNKLLYFKVINRNGATNFNTTNMHFNRKIGSLSKGPIANLPKNTPENILALKVIFPTYSEFYQSVKREIDNFCIPFKENLNKKIHDLVEEKEAAGEEEEEEAKLDPIKKEIEYLNDMKTLADAKNNQQVLTDVLPSVAARYNVNLTDSLKIACKRFYLLEALSCKADQSKLLKGITDEVTSAIQRLENLMDSIQ